MNFRRLMAALLVAAVLATGTTAAVHAHAADPGAHDSGACAVCRLAHEASPAALAPATLPVVTTEAWIFDAPTLVTHDPELDLGRSPRAPPRPEPT